MGYGAEPTRRRRADRHGIRERGFLLLTVMVLMFVATLMVGWGLRRATMQSRITDLRLADYQLHHERMGLIALGERWLRQETTSELTEHARSRRPAYTAVLPNDARIRIHVFDGQGILLGRVESASGVVRDFLLDALTLVPPGEGDLIRAFGPVPVSLRAAPDGVLRAIAGGDEQVVEILEKLRSDLPETDQRLKVELTRADLDDVLNNRLANLLTVDPKLWRLEAEVTDQQGSRRYEILIEFRGNIVKTHMCRMLPESEDRSGDARRR